MKIIDWLFSITPVVCLGYDVVADSFTVREDAVRFHPKRKIGTVPDAERWEALFHEVGHWVQSPLDAGHLLHEQHGLRDVASAPAKFQYRATYVEATAFAVASTLLRMCGFPRATSIVERTGYAWNEQTWFDGTDFKARETALMTEWPLNRIRARWVERCAFVESWRRRGRSLTQFAPAQSSLP